MVERGGVVELLSKLNEEDIFALAKTVTQGLLKFDNQNGKILKKYIFVPSINIIFCCRRNIWNIEIFLR